MPRRVSRRNFRRRGGTYGNLNEGKCYSNPEVIKHLMNGSIVSGSFGGVFIVSNLNRAQVVKK